MQRPRIVSTVADVLGYVDLGCYGGRAGTNGPVLLALDALAADGLRFTDGYAHAVCSPACFALMTGRWQYRLRSAEPLLICKEA